MLHLSYTETDNWQVDIPADSETDSVSNRFSQDRVETSHTVKTEHKCSDTEKAIKVIVSCIISATRWTFFIDSSTY